jgi:hypothetical protein
MSARSMLIQLAAKTGMLIAALFVVTVLLAAIPQHKDASGQVVGEPVGDMRSRGPSDAEPQTIVVHASAEKMQEAEQLVGAMYTMPKRATEEQLNARVPLSVAMWRLHTNPCMPPRTELKNADWTKFGLHGSIASKDACDAAAGRCSPAIFGWMVHVHPYEDSLNKTLCMHHHME